MNCTQCYWWTTSWGCYNSNWTTGRVTDPAKPVCEGLSFKSIPIQVMK